MKNFFFIVFFFTSNLFFSQSIVGYWENIDEKTGKVDSVVKVYKKDGKIYAKIHEILFEDHKHDVCSKCNDERKNKPILGLDIIKPGLVKKGKKWVGGKILDARNGKTYDVYFQLITKNKIKIRGFIGFPIFGKNAYWLRSKKY